MASPLPGMNPFLEQPELWSEFHSRVIVAIADAWDDLLRRTYRVAVEKQEVQERYLAIREGSTGEVITTLELLSPKNKKAGEGRDAYLQKRQQILTSATHFVEIDLLRGGMPLPLRSDVRSDYRILVSRSADRPQAQLYAFNLRQAIPAVAVPLRSGEAEPILQLQPLLHQVYDRARFELAIDYAQRLKPRLSEGDAEWVNQQVQG